LTNGFPAVINPGGTYMWVFPSATTSDSELIYNVS